MRYKKCFVLFCSKMRLILDKQHEIPGSTLLLCPVPLEMTPNEPSNKLFFFCWKQATGCERGALSERISCSVP